MTDNINQDNANNPYLLHLNSYVDLRTTHEDIRAGFVAQFSVCLSIHTS